MAKQVKLTESELRRIINESIDDMLNEMEMDEGWFGDKWKQVKSAAQTATQGGDMSLKNRFANAKKNYNTQGNINNLSNLIQQLSDYVDNGQIDPQKTVAQLIGGKYNNGRFGSMNGKLNNMKSQISKRGGESY